MLKAFFNLLKDTIQAWAHDKASRQAAALSYYSLFSLAPLLALVTIVIGNVLGNLISDLDEAAIQEQIIILLEQNVDQQTAAFIADLLNSFLDTSGSTLATVISLGVMAFAASNLLVQLQESLDVVWNVRALPDRGVIPVLKDRTIAFAVIGIIGLLLIATFIISTVLKSLESFLHEWIPGTAPLLPYADFLISLILVTVLFAMIYKFLPRVHIVWRDVWVGALVTAFLFSLGKAAISFYIARSNPASAFGVAGSLVLVMVWFYYSAMIFLMGAEFTKVYANRYGSRIRPVEGAVYRIPVRAPTQEPNPQNEQNTGITATAASVSAVPPGLPSQSATPPQPNTPRPGPPSAATNRPEHSFHYGWLLAAAVTFLLGIILGGERRS
jgi:membrane protein